MDLPDSRKKGKIQHSELTFTDACDALRYRYSASKTGFIEGPFADSEECTPWLKAHRGEGFAPNEAALSEGL